MGLLKLNTLQAMLKFWTTMHQDKKYIKTSTVGDMEAGLAPDTVSMATGTNCTKIGLPGKLILSKREGLWETIFS